MIGKLENTFFQKIKAEKISGWFSIILSIIIIIYALYSMGI